MPYHPSHPQWEATYRTWYPLPVPDTRIFRRPKSRETLEKERVEATVRRWVCPTCYISHPESWKGCDW